MIRLILADDHALTRAGLYLLLDRLDGITVVDEANNGREAVELVGKHRPDVVVMDIGMPELNGIEATERIARQFPQIRVIILSTFSDQGHVLSALEAGAKGYLLKSTDPSTLELAIRAVASGKTFLCPAIASHVIDQSLHGSKTIDGPLSRITPRQREILQLIAEGKSTKEIAFLLNVSVKTVETHRTQLMQRLNIQDIPALVRIAMHAGLVPP